MRAVLLISGVALGLFIGLMPPSLCLSAVFGLPCSCGVACCGKQSSSSSCCEEKDAADSSENRCQCTNCRFLPEFAVPTVDERAIEGLEDFPLPTAIIDYEGQLDVTCLASSWNHASGTGPPGLRPLYITQRVLRI